MMYNNNEPDKWIDIFNNSYSKEYRISSKSQYNKKQIIRNCHKLL